MEIISGILLATVIYIIYFIRHIKRAFKYWEERNVPFIKPIMPYGTPGNTFFNVMEIGRLNRNNYEIAKSKGYKHVGLFVFWKPIYMPIDPQIIRTILSKDFSYFSERGIFVNAKDDPLSAHLFSLEHTQWRSLRVKLTQAFTSRKMKMMFEILLDCSNQLKHQCDKLISRDGMIETKELFHGFTSNIIVNCAFGIECNVFENINSKFSKCGIAVVEASKNYIVKSNFGIRFPKFARLVKLKLIDPKITGFFYSTIKDTIEYRNLNNVRRNDFLQLLIDIQNNPVDNGDGLKTEEIAAQALIFFLGGFETSAATLLFCVYELCLNTDIQDKVRKEIVEVLEKYDNKLTYDAMVEMKYLNQVVHETLRKYPPLPSLHRMCVKDYIIPETNKIIEKGTIVMISTWGLHHDPEYFKHPEKFDPERFSDENKGNIAPFTYLPFGDGPRNCIAIRFGLMQTKVGLITIIKNYMLSLNAKTAVPMVYDPNSYPLNALGGVWVNAKKIN